MGSSEMILLAFCPSSNSSFTCSSSSLSSSSPPSLHSYRFFSSPSWFLVLGDWRLVMEGKKGTTGSSSSSIADQLFGRKEAAGILGEVFQPPASGVARVGKEPQTSDLFESSKKQQATESQTWNAQSGTADAKAQGSPSKGQTAPYKDRFCGEAVDTSSLGSSLYYGGPDICSNFSSSQTYGSQYPPKKNDEDDPEDSNMASRGNWWQGSLYY